MANEKVIRTFSMLGADGAGKTALVEALLRVADAKKASPEGSTARLDAERFRAAFKPASADQPSLPSGRTFTFPVTGNSGAIRLNFSMATPSSNALVDNMMMTSPAMTTNGGVRLGSLSQGIPTLSEWGLIAFSGGLLLSALFLLRRRSIPS